MSVIDILILVIILAWLGGFTLHIGGGLIHLLLIVALVLLIVRLIQGKKF
jgi:hypothetical protein